MPRGPRGETRPADVIGAAVKVMRIATGEEEDVLHGKKAGGMVSIEKGKLEPVEISRNKPSVRYGRAGLKQIEKVKP